MKIKLILSLISTFLLISAGAFFFARGDREMSRILFIGGLISMAAVLIWLIAFNKKKVWYKFLCIRAFGPRWLKFVSRSGPSSVWPTAVCIKQKIDKLNYKKIQSVIPETVRPGMLSIGWRPGIGGLPQAVRQRLSDRVRNASRSDRLGSDRRLFNCRLQ